MPVVTSSSFADRLRDIKKRIDIRPSIVNAHRRCQSAYETVSVGSPHLVQEFYKHIKVYKQCPQNDLLFMNMTVQLARASVFPTKSMFKQMEKFEKHMEDVMKAEGADWVTAGLDAAKGIEILSGRNNTFMNRYVRYKCRSLEKKRDKERKTAKKNAKILAAVKDARTKSQNTEIMNRHTEALKKLQKDREERAHCAPVSNFRGANEVLAAKIEEAKKKKKTEADEVANQLIEVVEKIIATSDPAADKKPEGEEKTDKENQVEEEKNLDDVEDGEEDEEEEEEAKDSSSSDDTSADESDPEEVKETIETALRKDDVCHFVQPKAVEPSFHVDEDSDFEKPELSEHEDSDVEESIEKIEEKDVDALEYEML